MDHYIGLEASNVPRIGLKDCGITRRRILLLGAELERGAMVQEGLSVEDLSVGTLGERRRKSRRQAYKLSLTWSERNARWAALSVVHATSRVPTYFIAAYYDVKLLLESAVSPSR